jgi:hypothetical protein
VISFLHPWLLVALGAAAVPILLHLVSRRDPPVVIFPAVRYLVTATREHERRFRVRHWLLLALRTLLVVALVLAASGPLLPPGRSGAAGHAPTALVLIVDNSPSSGAIVGGTPVLESLVRSAKEVVARSEAEDRLWLVTADGVARPGDPGRLDHALDSLRPVDRRMDLGEALGAARGLLETVDRPGEIVLISDLQATAVTPATVTYPLLVARPAAPAPDNAGLSSLDPGPQPWTGENGQVLVGVSGAAGPALPASVALAGRPPKRILVAPGGVVALQLTTGTPGWRSLEATLPADELRADDRRNRLVRVAPAAAVACPADEPYLAAACGALESGARIRRGTDVTMGSLGPGASVVEPPSDPALVGALNRALERRGVGWRFGAPVVGAQVTDSGPWIGRVTILRRYRLESSGSGRTGVLATVASEPWMVRGAGVVMLGSRLDPSWTPLPLQAGFVPLVDALANRLARAPLWLLDAAPGDAVFLPDATTRVLSGERGWEVEGGAAFHPPATGVYFLVSGRDTLGGLSVNIDPRESVLTRASDEAIGAAWPGARITDPSAAAERAFVGAGRADLRGPLLWLALACGLGEVLLASGAGAGSRQRG